VIDTHAHLDACAEPTEVLLARARSAGVDRVVTIGTGIESARASLAIAEREPGVFAALGIHPHDAGGDESMHIAGVRELLGHERAIAVGETGLDFLSRIRFSRDAQLHLFEAHLELAAELDLPVVIHSRAASRQTADALAAFPGTVVLHCFSEPELLSVAVDRGYYVSFAGNVTYPRAEGLRSAAAAVPGDRLLAETDCPYLAPQPVRGRPCEPSFVTHTLDLLADARGVTATELAACIDANADRAFSSGERATRRPQARPRQNFLVDPNILGVIDRLAAPPTTSCSRSVQGLGVLTTFLADRVRFVHAVEIDRSLEAQLRGAIAPRMNVELVFGDAMRLDLGSFDPAPASSSPISLQRPPRRSSSTRSSEASIASWWCDGSARGG
jgi:TatD DNase family protein